MSAIILKADNTSIIKDARRVYLTADVSSGTGTINVESIAGLADGNYLLLGELGSPTAEIVSINDGSLDTSITLAANTTYDHYLGEPVTHINFNQIEFSRATTLTGSKSVLATQAITPQRLDTVYIDTTNTTGYWFYRYKDAGAGTFSDYFTGQNYTGNADNSAEKIIERARNLAGVDETSDFATITQMLADINSAQDMILQARDPRTGVSINWAFELAEEKTSIQSTENENVYDLSDLTATIKYHDTKEAILNVRFGSKVIDYIDPDEMDRQFNEVKKTTVATEANSGDTSIVLADTNEFADSGTFVVGSDTVTYTAKDDSTATLSGIPSSGTGSITATHAVGATVWQNINPGLPTKYTIFNGQIILNYPVKSTYAGYYIKLKFLKVLDRLTDIASTTDIPFYNIIEWYCASRIEYRKGNTGEGDRYMQMFNVGLTNNMRRYKLPPLEEVTTYDYDNAESVMF